VGYRFRVSDRGHPAEERRGGAETRRSVYCVFKLNTPMVVYMFVVDPIYGSAT
jgi:hypothetical protein